MKKTKAIFMAAVLAVSALLLSAANVGAVSEEARRHMDRGLAAVEMAKTPDDYERAISEFEKARSLAPDWSDVYYNLGLVQEKAGKYGDAAVNFKKYLRLAPNSNEAAEVKSLINKLEFKAEQVLTVPEIINVLVSLSDEKIWQVAGDCKKDDFDTWYGNKLDFRRLDFKREGDDAVKSLKDFQYVPYPTFQILQVTGPVLKYVTTRNVDSRKNPDLTGIMEHEIEIVSKRLIKVNQKVVRGGIVNGISDGQRFSCTFRAK